MESRLAYCWDCHTITRATRKRVNTALHLVLALITVGVWLLIYLLNLAVREPWRCQDCASTYVSLGTKPEVDGWAVEDAQGGESDGTARYAVGGISERGLFGPCRRFLYRLMGVEHDSTQ